MQTIFDSRSSNSETGFQPQAPKRIIFSAFLGLFTGLIVWELAWTMLFLITVSSKAAELAFFQLHFSNEAIYFIGLVLFGIGGLIQGLSCGFLLGWKNIEKVREGAIYGMISPFIPSVCYFLMAVISTFFSVVYLMIIHGKFISAGETELIISGLSGSFFGLLCLSIITAPINAVTGMIVAFLRNWSGQFWINSGKSRLI